MFIPVSVGNRIHKCLSVTNYVVYKLKEFCYGVSEIPERYLEVTKVFFNLSR
jgi:hypothetical protein